MTDSGARSFFDGEYYYRQFGELAINLSVAKTVTDAHWREYMEGSLAIARKLGKGPKVSLAAFVHQHPNAVQRRFATEFLAKEQVRPIERLAVITESELIRGALIALGWLMPRARMRAFHGSDHREALAWLGQVAEFDEKQAGEIWTEARAQLGVVKRNMF